MKHIDLYAVVAAALGLLVGFIKSQIRGYLIGALNWFVCGHLAEAYNRIFEALRNFFKAQVFVITSGKKAWEKFTEFEVKVANVLSHVTQSPHWLFFWIVYAILWTVWRQVFPHPWYDDAKDLLVITWFSAIIPAIVEYSLKYSQGIQLKEQLKITDLLISQLNLNIAIAQSTAKKLDYVSEELAELDNDKATPSSTE